MRIVDDDGIMAFTRGDKAALKMESRLSYMDIARALSMLYIIGIWHMNSYVRKAVLQSTIGVELCEMLTYVALATFTFISGFFLLNTNENAISFLKKRAIRIIPLFWLSSLSLLIVSIIWGGYFTSYAQFGLTLIGLVCYVMEPPLTVWYVSMLLSFYLLTPLFNSFKRYRIAAAGVFYGTILLLSSCQLLHIDKRVLIYFPFYILGGVLQGENTVEKINRYVGIAAIVVFSLLTVFGLGKLPVVRLLVILCGLIGVLYLSKVLSQIPGIDKFAFSIGYGSMVAYLFHRQYFGVIYKVFGKLNWLPVIVVFMPMLLIISYLTQKVYDFFAGKLGIRNARQGKNQD